MPFLRRRTIGVTSAILARQRHNALPLLHVGSLPLTTPAAGSRAVAFGDGDAGCELVMRDAPDAPTSTWYSLQSSRDPDAPSLGPFAIVEALLLDGDSRLACYLRKRSRNVAVMAPLTSWE